ncbi:hypothetical protein SH611_20060 [Geminicoccaceae bacterium 1502E]|nr:hypothetical protein [Geminicoccaceae bacterium 1502E]
MATDMAAQNIKTPQEEHESPSLADLMQNHAQDSMLSFADIPPEESGEPAVALAATDLMQDENGEVVLFNDSNLRSLALTSEAGIVAQGEARDHVTAGGEDVSGFKYLTFENGLTVYYQPHLDLVVRHEPA